MNMTTESIAQPDIPPTSFVADVPCDLVSLHLPDSYPAGARLFPAVNATRAVLYLHGIQSHGGWFLRSCDHLRRQGVTVLLPDRRGSGLNQTDRGHCDSARQLLADVDFCADWLRRRCGIERIDIVAVSWGGKLGLIYAAEQPAKIRSLTLVTPGLCARIDISLPEKIAIGAHGLISPKKPHEIPLNDPNLFTENPAMLDFLRCDPIKLTHATASFFLTSRKLDHLVRRHARRLTVPTHLFLAARDRIIDNRATTALLPAAATKTYPQAHHTLDFEPDPQPFFNDLTATLL